MSNKCEHNNHTHFLLWFWVWALVLGSFFDCTGERTRMKNDINDLQRQVRELQQRR